jgi:hypothetical protein
MSLGSDNANWSMERLVEITELKTKVADLEAKIEHLKEVCVRNQNVMSELFDRCLKHKQDINRLLVAGNAMAERMEDDGETHPESDNWWDAKNGGISK